MFTPLTGTTSPFSLIPATQQTQSIQLTETGLSSAPADQLTQLTETRSSSVPADQHTQLTEVRSRIMSFTSSSIYMTAEQEREAILTLESILPRLPAEKQLLLLPQILMADSLRKKCIRLKEEPAAKRTESESSSANQQAQLIEMKSRIMSFTSSSMSMTAEQERDAILTLDSIFPLLSAEQQMQLLPQVIMIDLLRAKSIHFKEELTAKQAPKRTGDIASPSSMSSRSAAIMNISQTPTLKRKSDAASSSSSAISPTSSAEVNAMMPTSSVSAPSRRRKRDEETKNVTLLKDQKISSEPSRDLKDDDSSDVYEIFNVGSGKNTISDEELNKLLLGDQDQ